MIHLLSPSIIKILKTIEAEGYQALLVGGAVRDLLLGIEPGDYDLATSASPDVIKKIFEKHLSIGENFGTIKIQVDGKWYEVTTFRKDILSDGRKPQKVIYSQSFEEDAARRDFTMNALALDSKGELYDYYGGKKDLEKGEVNFIGDPLERIREDKLRLLRWIRFQVTYQFTTSNRISSKIDIRFLSQERIQSEFNKMLLSSSPSKAISLLLKQGLLEQMIPELMDSVGFQQYSPYHHLDVFEHTLKVLDHTPAVLCVRLAALFHDIGKPGSFSLDQKGQGHFYGHHRESSEITSRRLREMKYSQKIIDQVVQLVHFHMVRYDEVTKAQAKKLLNKMGEENIFHLIALLKADRLSKAQPIFLGDIERLEKMCSQILEAKEAFSLKDLRVNGHDLMKIGLRGKDIGEALDRVLKAVIHEEIPNEEEAIIRYIIEKRY